MADDAMFNDRIAGEMAGWDAPATNGAAVTVSDDTADPSGPFRGLWVGAAGIVKVTTRGGSTITLVGVAAGTLLPIAVSRVWSSTTSVASPGTNIIGLR